MRYLCLVVAGLLGQAAAAQEAVTAPGGLVRVLDKTTGEITDLDLAAGDEGHVGRLAITLMACRYPPANPAGDAYGHLVIRYNQIEAPVFEGWMLAASPALKSLDNPRYDVWMLRCKTS